MVNAPSSPDEPDADKTARQPGTCPPDCDLPENSKENLDAKLDHAIEETFPTSDPISVNITKGSAIEYDCQDDTSSVAAEGRAQAEQDTAEHLLDQVRDALRDVVGRASSTARQAYSQGERYVRQARDRYPEAERSDQEGSRAIHQRLTENLWLSLLIAGAIGYTLAWMIHGRWGSRRERVPDSARTERGYAPHRNKHPQS